MLSFLDLNQRNGHLNFACTVQVVNLAEVIAEEESFKDEQQIKAKFNQLQKWETDPEVGAIISGMSKEEQLAVFDDLRQAKSAGAQLDPLHLERTANEQSSTTSRTASMNPTSCAAPVSQEQVEVAPIRKTTTSLLDVRQQPQMEACLVRAESKASVEPAVAAGAKASALGAAAGVVVPSAAAAATVSEKQSAAPIKPAAVDVRPTNDALDAETTRIRELQRQRALKAAQLAAMSEATENRSLTDFPPEQKKVTHICQSSTRMHVPCSLIVAGMLTGQGHCNEDQKEVCKLGKKEVTAGRGCLGKRQEVSRHSRSKGSCCMSTIRKTSPLIWPLLGSQPREPAL